jgi:hypothetical protein
LSYIVEPADLTTFDDDARFLFKLQFLPTTFNDLREGKWLDNWMLMASIQMSDKPHFIRYGDCIPLDEHSRRGLKPIRKPLDRWRKTIEASQMECSHWLVRATVPQSHSQDRMQTRGKRIPFIQLV